METKITSTQNEHSLTVKRDDGTSIDFCCDNKEEVTIAHSVLLI